MFGGGSGHIFEMIARLKANEALRNKKNYFKTMKNTFGVSIDYHDKNNELNTEELRKIPGLMREKEFKENKQNLIYISLLLIIVISTFLLIKFWIV